MEQGGEVGGTVFRRASRAFLLADLHPTVFDRARGSRFAPGCIWALPDDLSAKHAPGTKALATPIIPTYTHGFTPSTGNQGDPIRALR